MDIKAPLLTGLFAVAFAFGVACQTGPVATPSGSGSPDASPTETAPAPSVNSPTETTSDAGSPTEPARAAATPSSTETTPDAATPSPTEPAPTPTAAPSPTPTLVPPPTAAPAATPTPKYSVQDGTPLHQAALDTDAAEVERLLDQGADINAKAGIFYVNVNFLHTGATPLHVATALNPDPAVAALLIDRGTDIEARTDHGATPPALGGV